MSSQQNSYKQHPACVTIAVLALERTSDECEKALSVNRAYKDGVGELSF